MKRLTLAALAVACSLTLGGCLTAVDRKIAEVSDKLAARCVELQTATAVVDLFAPEKVRIAIANGRAVIATFCAAPPRSAAELAIATGKVLEAVQAIETAKRG